jgi:hypothetical protein
VSPVKLPPVETSSLEVKYQKPQKRNNFNFELDETIGVQMEGTIKRNIQLPALHKRRKSKDNVVSYSPKRNRYGDSQFGVNGYNAAHLATLSALMPEPVVLDSNLTSYPIYENLIQEVPAYQSSLFLTSDEVDTNALDNNIIIHKRHSPAHSPLRSRTNFIEENFHNTSEYASYYTQPNGELIVQPAQSPMQDNQDDKTEETTEVAQEVEHDAQEEPEENEITNQEEIREESESEEEVTEEEEPYTPTEEDIHFSSMIRLQYGSMTCDVTPLSPESAIQNKFGFDDVQLLYMMIVGLKDGTTNEMLPFIADPEIPYLRHLNLDSARAITLDQVYEVVFEDLRKTEISDLTAEEMLEIRKRFEDLDLDGSGEISETEVHEYYNKQFEESIAKFKEIKERKLLIITDEEERAGIIQRFEDHRNHMQKFFDAKLKTTMKRDIDRDGVISWAEFFLSEAMEMRRIRNASTKQPEVV